MKLARLALVALFTLSGACQKGSDKPADTDEAETGTGDSAEGAATVDPKAAKTPTDKAVPAGQRKEIPAPPDVAAPPEDADQSKSGLAWKVLQPGEGTDRPNEWDSVSVNYTGWTTDGKMFDSSVSRGRPAKFPLNGVIPGWTEGLQLMTKGEKRRFWIPAKLAYEGRPGPQGTLVFDVELLEVIPGPKPIAAPEDVAAAPKDAKKTKSGLAYKFLTKGTSKDKPREFDKVEVHYTGWTTDGKMFDSSVTRNRPATFPLNRVIPGWTEGMQLLAVGDKARLWIPEELAYKGQPGRPQGMLVFDVELLKIEKMPEPPKTPKDVAKPPKNAKKTDSGLVYKVLSKGKGTEHPTATSRVKVHYSGWTTDGKMFDSSVTRGDPATFGLNAVIPGWTEGLQLMVVGEKARIWVPEELAYKGRPGRPQGMLVFDVELLEILN